MYYAALKQPPPSHNILAPKRDPTLPKEKRQIHFFNIDQELVYWNFFLDFGPLNLGQLTRFCHKLNDKLRKFPVVCFYSSTQPAKRANAQFLICAWQVLYLKRSPRQAYQGFQVNDSFQQSTSSLFSMNPETDGDNQHPSQQQQEQQQSGTQQLLHSLPPISQSQGAPTVAALPPFHDASPVACTYELSVLDCLDGLVKAVQFGFWNIDDFDLEEYEHFEQVEVRYTPHWYYTQLTKTTHGTEHTHTNDAMRGRRCVCAVFWRICISVFLDHPPSPILYSTCVVALFLLYLIFLVLCV